MQLRCDVLLIPVAGRQYCMQHCNNIEEDHGEAYAAKFSQPSSLSTFPIRQLAC